jgi:hypothetical protein
MPMRKEPRAAIAAVAVMKSRLTSKRQSPYASSFKQVGSARLVLSQTQVAPESVRTEACYPVSGYRTSTTELGPYVYCNNVGHGEEGRQTSTKLCGEPCISNLIRL